MGQIGCVRRRLTVRSNPPGALVYVDKTPIGTTPVSTSFTYYGTREIKLVKGGYETLTVKQRIWAPWYEIFPLDFISENLIPREIRDDRVLDYQMAPQQAVSDDELRSRAEGLRQVSQAQAVGQIAPAPVQGVLPPPAGVQPAVPYSPPAYVPANPAYVPPPGAGNFQPAPNQPPSNTIQPALPSPSTPPPYGGQPPPGWQPAPRSEQISPG